MVKLSVYLNRHVSVMWISRRERMTVDNISWIISMKECCRTQQGSNPQPPGPSCSKLAMSLVNDSFLKWYFKWKFKWYANMLNFFAEKMWVAFAHIFSAKNIRILYIESTEIVNEMTLNELVKLTTLWTTGPWSPVSLMRVHLSHQG